MSNVVDSMYYEDTINTDSPVLKNKLNIRDASKLKEIELFYSQDNIETVNDNIKGNFDLTHLQAYHKYIFGELYEWPGNIRKYNIVKYEETLNGASVQYDDFVLINKNIVTSLNNFRSMPSNTLEEKRDSFSKTLVDVWVAHPFQEGNTRTISTFMCDYANSLGYKIDNKLFSKHGKYFRNSLVQASYGVDKYLIGIVEDSLTRGQQLNNLAGNKATTDIDQLDNDPGYKEYLKAKSTIKKSNKMTMK